jgi:hypothetical protein
MLKALRMHAELNLGKLRSCRNIAGLKREGSPYAVPTDSTNGAGGQLALTSAKQIRPTLYHYATLDFIPIRGGGARDPDEDESYVRHNQFP